MIIETTKEKKVYTEDAFYTYVQLSDRDPKTYDQFLDKLLDEIEII